ncbi:porin [Pseudothauera lacus]|uniref:Porin n=1 Tax=Pseudothauera lacus TaxID=2136175 RepID=A0A2T4ICK7_9RHOO|nr:porin [Pseudothauera lacus]PTD95499.1 porin [Pseudothauera lacus]
MQKKLIALAVAGLVSAPAFAQSNVTVFGIMDVGLQHTTKSMTANQKSRTGVDTGLQSGSRLGFRGTEDLGNGLAVSFQYVFNINNGVVNNDAPATREAMLALSGNFGTIAAGYLFTPQFNLLTSVDPFGNGTVGAVNGARGIYSLGAHRAVGTANGNIDRLENLVAYISPNFGGFTVTAGYTFNGLDDEGAKNTGNAKIWAISPVYNNGPLMVGANYHRIKIDAPAGPTNTVWDLAASYDFGVLKLGAAYGQSKLTSTPKEKQWMIGATVPVSEAGSVLVSYARNKFDDAKQNKWALGYTHSLSKRTNVYAAYARLSGNTAGKADFGNNAGFGGDDYTRGLNIGLRHRF